jgi:hypothetical protein
MMIIGRVCAMGMNGIALKVESANNLFLSCTVEAHATAIDWGTRNMNR